MDDLSAGEKEILYGYLRIRNSAPRFSIILIDEPELHLNPRLISGLPQFYRKNLGLSLDNQIWLVSHSDALLREAVGKDGFNVYHMQPCSIVSNNGHITIGANQLKSLELKDDVDAALADIVGDLAAFRPDSKVVIFEGGGDADFDRWMTLTLYPEFSAKHNLISGSNRHKVKSLHAVLDKAFNEGNIKTQFFAIVDADYDEGGPDSQAVRRFVWPVYHIENFLLDPEVISQVVSPFFKNPISSEHILDSLKQCARSTVPNAIRHQVTGYASQELMRCINLRFDPSADDVGSAMHEAVARSIQNAHESESRNLSRDTLQQVAERAKIQIESAFADGTWRSKLPGRSILKAFSNTLPNGVSHEVLRTMIVNKMMDIGRKPEGMTEILNKIMISTP